MKFVCLSFILFFISFHSVAEEIQLVLFPIIDAEGVTKEDSKLAEIYLKKKLETVGIKIISYKLEKGETKRKENRELKNFVKESNSAYGLNIVQKKINDSYYLFLYS